MTKKLWRVTLRSSLRGYSPCYVVATDPTTAYQTVRADLDRKDYGFTGQRELSSIDLIAEEYEYTNTEARLFIG